MQNNTIAILSHFEREGFSSQSLMRPIDLVKILDHLANKNANIKQFNRQIAQQLWDNTLKNQQGDCVKLQDYIQTLANAQSILSEKLKIAQQKYSTETNEEYRKDLMVDIYYLSQDEKMINAPFKMKQSPKTALIQQSQASINSINQGLALSIFADTAILQRKLSIGLTFVAYAISIAFLFQLSILMTKYGFFSLLNLIFVLCIYLLNYFDRIYIQFLFLSLIASIFIDSVWLAMKIKSYWNSQSNDWDRGHQSSFLRFTIIATIIIAILKFFTTIMLYRYRNNPHGLRKKAHLLMFTFHLDANPVRNPLTPVILKTFPKFMIS